MRSNVQSFVLSKTTEDGRPVEDGSAACRYCKLTVIVHNDNTSNLFSHLCTQHPEKYVVAVKAKKKAEHLTRKDKFSKVSSSSGTQSSIDESFAQVKKYDKRANSGRSIS